MTEYDAEPGTTDTEYVAEAVEAEPTINDELGQLPPQVAALIADMWTELQELRTQVAEQAEPDLTEFQEPERTPLPEGTRRYYDTQYVEQTLIRVSGKNILYNGEKVNIPQQDIPFMGRVYTTSDPEEIEFIENHEQFNVTLFRADDAMPDHRLPGLSTGARDSGSTPRGNPLAAPMQ